MATIWITIVEMGGNPSKMENTPKPNAPRNNAANSPRNNAANAPKPNAPRNNATNAPKPNTPRNNAANAPKPNAPRNNAANAPKPNALRNGANSPRLPEEEHGHNLEAGVGNVSVTGTTGNNRSRRPSNANSVEPEVAAFEVDPQTGGRRRSRKSRKSRRSKRSY